MLLHFVDFDGKSRYIYPTIILSHNFVYFFLDEKFKLGSSTQQTYFALRNILRATKESIFSSNHLSKSFVSFKFQALCSQYLRTKASIFEGQPPQNKALSNQNKGHLGSRSEMLLLSLELLNL